MLHTSDLNYYQTQCSMRRVNPATVTIIKHFLNAGAWGRILKCGFVL